MRHESDSNNRETYHSELRRIYVQVASHQKGTADAIFRSVGSGH